MRTQRLFAILPSNDFDAAIAAFITFCKTKNLSDQTVEFYERRLKSFAKYAQFIGETPSTFSRQTVVAFISQLLQRVKPQTANTYLRTLSAFGSFLVSEGYRSDNPVRGIPKVKEPQHYPRTLSDEQLVALLNQPNTKTFAGLRDLTMMLLMCDAGLRVSEVCGLTVSDVDLSQGFVLVRQGKGRKERVVPIGETTLTMLRRYLSIRLSKSLPTDKLFVTAYGEPMNRRRVHHRLTAYARKANIEGVRVSPHTLRFTFVRKWLQSGGDSLVLQRILGHTTPTMTSYYARLFATDLKDAHKRHSPVDNIASMLKLPKRRVFH